MHALWVVFPAIRHATDIGVTQGALTVGPALQYARGPDQVRDFLRVGEVDQIRRNQIQEAIGVRLAGALLRDTGAKSRVQLPFSAQLRDGGAGIVSGEQPARKHRQNPHSAPPCGESGRG